MPRSYLKALVSSFALLLSSMAFGQNDADIYALGYKDGKPVVWKNGVVSQTLSKENGETYSSIVELDGKIYICGNIGKKSAAWDINGNLFLHGLFSYKYYKSGYTSGNAIVHNHGIYIPGEIYYGTTAQTEGSHAIVWMNGAIAILNQKQMGGFPSGVYEKAMSIATNSDDIYVTGYRRYGNWKDNNAPCEIFVWINGYEIYTTPIPNYGTGVGNQAHIGIYKHDVYVAGKYFNNGFKPFLIKNGAKMDIPNCDANGFVALAVSKDKMWAIGNSNEGKIKICDSNGLTTTISNFNPVVRAVATSAFVHNDSDIYIGGYVYFKNDTFRAALWKNGILHWVSPDSKTQINSFLLTH